MTALFAAVPIDVPLVPGFREWLEDRLGAWLFDPVVSKLVAVAVVITAALIVLAVTRRAVDRTVQDNRAAYRAKRGLTVLVWLVAFVALLAVFGEKLGQLTVAFGVAGAGIAFALQEVIVSVAGYLANLSGRFYRVGDRILLGGLKGDVVDIGVLRTTLMELGDWVNGDQYNGRIVRVPNSKMLTEPVFNYTADFSFVWDELTIPVAYGSDIEMTKRCLLDAADQLVGQFTKDAEANWSRLSRDYRIEAASTHPTVFLWGDANWLTFSLRYVVDIRQRRVVKTALFERILAAFDASGGQVRVASSTLDITSVPPVVLASPSP